MIRTASSRPKRWLRPPPHATACFSSARRPGVVLRVSSTAAPVPVDRVDVAARQRRDPGQPAEEVQRDALAGQDRALRAGDARDDRGRLRPRRRRSRAPRSGRSGSRARNVDFGGAETADDARPPSRAARPSRPRPSATVASVVTSPAPMSSASAARTDPLERVRRYCHVSSTGSRARSQDDVPLEGLALRREVGPEVRAAALLARERALGDEPRQQVRRVEELREPGRVADEAAVAPERRAAAPASRARSAGASGTSGRLPGSAGSASAASAARRPKTRHSRSEFDASRFAPCTPVAAHSPAA